MTAPAEGRDFRPTVGDDLPPGRPPMLATLHARPGHEDQLAAAVHVLTVAVRDESGCREFRAFRAVEEPHVFHLLEVYSDVDAFRRHLGTDQVRRFFQELAAHSTDDAGVLAQLIELDSANQ